MGDIVNLRQVRRAKARDEKERLAAANRARHGLAKAERNRLRAEAEKAAGFVEGHRLPPRPGDRGSDG